MLLCVPEAQSILFPSLVLETLAIKNKFMDPELAISYQTFLSFPTLLILWPGNVFYFPWITPVHPTRLEEGNAGSGLSVFILSHAHPTCTALSFMKAALGILHMPWPQSYWTVYSSVYLECKIFVDRNWDFHFSICRASSVPAIRVNRIFAEQRNHCQC